jgi:hypothetical protein
MALNRWPPTKPRQSQTPLTLHSLFDRENCYPVYDHLCRILPLPDLLSLSKTCKSLYGNILRAQWDVEPHLCRFVRDHLKFRLQLAKFDALVSGSLALQLLTEWCGKSLTWTHSLQMTFRLERLGNMFLKLKVMSSCRARRHRTKIMRCSTSLRLVCRSIHKPSLELTSVVDTYLHQIEAGRLFRTENPDHPHL